MKHDLIKMLVLMCLSDLGARSVSNVRVFPLDFLAE